MTTEEVKSKAGQAHIYGTPVVAVILAILGYLGNRDANQDAQSKANSAGRQAEVAEVESKEFSETRLKTAYAKLQEGVNKALIAQDQRINDLEGWVVELEEFIEDQTEEDSPNTKRAREARDMRLAEIRAAKRVRERQPDPPAAMMVMDYDSMGLE